MTPQFSPVLPLSQYLLYQAVCLLVCRPHREFLEGSGSCQVIGPGISSTWKQTTPPPAMYQLLFQVLETQLHVVNDMDNKKTNEMIPRGYRNLDNQGDMRAPHRGSGLRPTH